MPDLESVSSLPPHPSSIASSQPSPLPQLPSSLQLSNTLPVLLTQGAEALLYRTTYLLPSISCALKYRPSKPYRHPILDARLTKHRILSEARVLVKCRKEGVKVPGVYALDEKKGWIMMEWIDGEVVRIRINEWIKERKESRTGRGLKREREEDEGEGNVKENEGVVVKENGKATDEEQDNTALLDLLHRIGTAVGRLHSIGVVHGDLTTSNLMLRPSPSTSPPSLSSSPSTTLQGEVILIDFGLASQSSADEDRAVDLYVLERAFGSTHPSVEGLFGEVLKGYGKSFGGAKVVLRKLEDVRMRGRKKSMIG